MPIFRRRLFGVTTMWALMGLLSAEAGAQPTFDIIRIGVEQGLSHRLVYDVLEDHQGYMWFATREGLNRFDGHRFDVYRHEPGNPLSIPHSKVTRLFESADSTLWIGSDRGLAWFDRSNETFHPVSFQDGAQQAFSEPVNDIIQTPDGTLWVMTWMYRLFRLAPGSTELKLLPVTIEGLSGLMPTHRMGVDLSGKIVLFCMLKEGKVRFMGRLDPEIGECSMDHVIPESSLLGAIGFALDGSTIASVTSAITTGSDRIGVLKWDGQLKWSVSLDAWLPRDLVVDDSDQIWLATLSGVFLLDPTGQVISHFTRSPVDHKTLSDDRANAVTLTRDGSVWVATEDGLTVFVPKKNPFQAIRHRSSDPTSLGDPRVNAILESMDGALWIGTSNGLFKRPVGTESFEPIDLPDVPGAPSGAQTRIWSLFEIAPGVIWFGTAAGGLYQLNTTTSEIRHVLTPHHLYTSLIGIDPASIDRTSIPFIGRDSLGNLWMATRQMVLRVDSVETFTLIAFELENTLRPGILVDILLQDRRGDYWTGNDLGLRAFDAETGEFQVVGEIGSRGRGLSYGSVWTMAESSLTPDALWIGSIGGGLNRYDVETGLFTWYTMAEGLPSNGVYGILVDDQGLLWMSTTNGLARFNPSTDFVERFTRLDGLHDIDFDLMAYHKGKVSGKMWFGGPTGVTEFHPDSVALSAPDFRVNISSISVLDQPYPGIVGVGDTLHLAHTRNSLGFRFSAPDLLHPDNVSYRFRLAGYDDGWRVNDATRPEVSYTQLPPGGYTFEVQAAGPGSEESMHTTRLVVSIVPAFWQTGWFRFLCLVLVLSAFGWGVSSVQRRRGRQATEVALREVELKRLLAEREEQERGRLAREIHDGPIQTLYSVNHRLEEASPDALSASRHDVRELAVELRAICEHLRPALVSNLGLEGALRSRVRTLSRRFPELTVSLSFSPGCSDLDETTGHACYRIVQEALSNVIQHSGASRVDIRLSRVDTTCRLLISDNGRGFSLPKDWLALVRDSHFGLVGMRERAEMQGGVCRIDSTPGQGTRIEVEFPMTP